MKVEKKNTYSWPSTGTYHKNLAILILFSTKSGEFGSSFFMKNPLIRGNYIFQVEIWLNLTSKKQH